MKFFNILKICFLLLFLFSLDAEENFSVNIEIQEASYSIADEATVKIVYSWPTIWKVEKEPDPSFILSSSGFLLVDIPPVKKIKTSLFTQRIWTMTLLLQKSGAITLPDFAFKAVSEKGKEHITKADEVILQVGIDIEEAKLSSPSLLWKSEDAPIEKESYFIYIILAVVLIIVIIFILLKKRKKITVLSPYERFMKYYSVIDEQSDIKQAGTLLSKMIRAYCGAIWEFDAIGLTTREVRGQLDSILDTDKTTKVISMLTDLDNMRWTTKEANEKILIEIKRLAMSFVREIESVLFREAENEK